MRWNPTSPAALHIDAMAPGGWRVPLPASYLGPFSTGGSAVLTADRVRPSFEEDRSYSQCSRSEAIRQRR